MAPGFTPAHRGGSGPPMVCLHGFTDTWRTWELVLPALEGEVTAAAVADAVEGAMDDAGVAAAHLVGNSLGGWLALELAARGRALTVVALAPAGGWAADERTWEALLDQQQRMVELAAAAAPYAETLLATPEGRRRATQLLTTRSAHLPAKLLAHQLRGIAACTGAKAMIDGARRGGWPVRAERITCPVRVLWGTADRLLPCPSAAVRYRREWLPHADWVVLDDVGHCPQLDVPLETAELILGFTAPLAAR
ncbi:MAG TPA: alpha/beta hydrolase [Baekduia sp.]|nr:alpha/beta hydrolase [Baekduia sp.]